MQGHSFDMRTRTCLRTNSNRSRLHIRATLYAKRTDLPGSRVSIIILSIRLF